MSTLSDSSAGFFCVRIDETSPMLWTVSLSHHARELVDCSELHREAVLVLRQVTGRCQSCGFYSRQSFTPQSGAGRPKPLCGGCVIEHVRRSWRAAVVATLDIREGAMVGP
jgi:hypothetical protein